MKKGIDISYYQNGINFDLLKEEVDFVILRIGYTGYGKSKSIQEDTCFEKFYAECKKRNIPVGAYYYSLATDLTQAINESNFVLEKLKGKTFEYPIYWDTEEPSEMRKYHTDRPTTIGKDKLSAVGKAFLQNIENQGYYVGIYASTDWLNNKLDMGELKSYDVWVAHYGVIVPSYKGNYGMWQYSSTGTINSYKGNVDMNNAYKDYPTIIKQANLNGFKGANTNTTTGTETSLKTELKAVMEQLQSIYDRM